ncbi:MAG: hypothetical protein WD401_01625 [Thermomicrobiaceae bacterium]
MRRTSGSYMLNTRFTTLALPVPQAGAVPPPGTFAPDYLALNRIKSVGIRKHAFRKMASVRLIRRFVHPRSMFGSGLALLATTLIHQRWKIQPHGTPAHGALDLLCHLGTASTVTLPVLPNIEHKRAFGMMAVGSAIMLDLDHVLAARSLEMNSWMTMPSRPPTHSLGTMILIAWVAERMNPGKRLWLAVMLGIGSHLLRDLATGGAPLWHPRRVITWPVPAVLATLAILTVSGWILSGIPVREQSLRLRFRQIGDGFREIPVDDQIQSVL